MKAFWMSMGFTMRESDVILLLQEGLTNQQIADRMFVSDKAVKWHLTKIFKKTNVKNRYELMSFIMKPLPTWELTRKLPEKNNA